jgi:translation elongation factor P/translation initiation factor 5A
MPTSTYDLIASNVLGSSASSVTFSSIPATYRDLVLVMDIKTTTTGRPEMQINSDTSSNYSKVIMTGDGTSATSTSGTSLTNIDFDTVTGASTENQLRIWQFMDYSATDKHKTILNRSNRAGARVNAGAARWASTSAITTILLTCSTGNFDTGSTFYLYGIVS